jgi:hypothetical protein
VGSRTIWRAWVSMSTTSALMGSRRTGIPGSDRRRSVAAGPGAASR